MNRKERIITAYEYLRSSGRVHTKYDVADIMGSNRSSICSALNGNEKYLTDNFLVRFNNAFNGIFNNKWLLLGEGEMLAPKAVIEQTFNSGKNVNSGTATNVGDTITPAPVASSSLEEVVRQQSEQIGKLIDDNAKRSEQIDKLINMLVEKL